MPVWEKGRPVRERGEKPKSVRIKETESKRKKEDRNGKARFRKKEAEFFRHEC